MTRLIVSRLQSPLHTVLEQRRSIRKEFQVEGVSVRLFKVIFDTGALHNSCLVEKHMDSWKSCIFPHRAVACLADQATRIETKEVVCGMLSFVSDDGKIEYQGEVEAVVWNMPGMDFILGLPEITRHFVELLTFRCCV